MKDPNFQGINKHWNKPNKMNTSITSCTSCNAVISYLSVLFQIRCNEPISTSVKLLQWNKFEIRLKIKSYIANNHEPKQNKSTEFSLLDLHHFPYNINYLKAVGCCNPHDSVGPINIITKKWPQMCSIHDWRSQEKKKCKQSIQTAVYLVESEKWCKTAMVKSN